MSRAAIIHTGAAATTITHVPGSGPSTISMNNGIMTIANALCTSIVLSNPAVPSLIGSPTGITDITGTVAAAPGAGAVFAVLGLSLTIATGTQPQTIAISAAGTFAYVTNFNSGTVSMYSINTNTGALTALTTPTVATGTNPLGIAISAAGTFAYVTNFDSNTVSMYSINVLTGILTPLSTPTVATGTKPFGIVIFVGQTGTFAYVTNTSSNTISMYSINATTGILTALTPPTIASSTPYGITISTSQGGTFAYVTNNSGRVSMYVLNATTGILTALSTPVVTGTNSIGIAILASQAGTFAYVTNLGSSNVSMYSINQETGILTALSTPTVATGFLPRGIAILASQSGTFAYVTNGGDNTVSIYSINVTTGILTALTTVATGNTPTTIVSASLAAGTFAYVVNNNDNTVSMYYIPASGILIPLTLGIMPAGTQIVVSGPDTGPLKITGYVRPTTYIVSSPGLGFFSLVDLAGNKVYTTGTAGSTSYEFSFANLTGIQNNVNSLSNNGILTIDTIGTPLAPGAAVTVSGTAIGGTIFGYSDPTTYYVADSPAPTTTSFTLVDFSGAHLSITLTAPATAITGLSYTTIIANSPLSVTSIDINGTISSTVGVTYATGMAVSVTGILTGTAVFTPSIDAQIGNVYVINASTAGTITLTSLTGGAIVTTAGTTTGLTFTPCPSISVISGTVANVLTVTPRATTSPINNRWTYAWQFFSGANWIAISSRFTIDVNPTTSSTLSATANTTAGDTGLYRCQITPTGTATTPITGATPTNSLPVFLSFQ